MIGQITRTAVHSAKTCRNSGCTVLAEHLFRTFCTNNDQTESANSMELSNVVKRLNRLAQPTLAGSWDNVGLLVEPTAPHRVEKILLTNDLTPPVLEEAISQNSSLIISYHPPIFAPIKRLTQERWKERIVIRCLENRIAVFSPHTTHDCLLGGVNDWLISCFDCKEVKPVEQHMELPESFTHSVRFAVPEQEVESLRSAFKLEQNLEVKETNSLEERCSFTVHCRGSGLTQVMKILQNKMDIVSMLEITELAKAPKIGYGMGRKAKLTSPVSVEEAVNKVKQHLNLTHVRLAKSPGIDKVSSIAVCAGSGSGVLRNVTADLYLTGEMSHHEVLHAVYNKTNVILCDHSNTERGYLTVLKSKLQECLGSDVQIDVSKVDSDPLQVV